MCIESRRLPQCRSDRNTFDCWHYSEGSRLKDCSSRSPTSNKKRIWVRNGKTRFFLVAQTADPQGSSSNCRILACPAKAYPASFRTKNLVICQADFISRPGFYELKLTPHFDRFKPQTIIFGHNNI